MGANVSVTRIAPCSVPQPPPQKENAKAMTFDYLAEKIFADNYHPKCHTINRSKKHLWFDNPALWFPQLFSVIKCHFCQHAVNRKHPHEC
jgi:hypothetical protein